jgi:predicted metal-dependent hydrolase
MLKPVEIRCSGCATLTLVPDGTKLHREQLCRKCFDEWMDLDRRASAELRKERRRWVSIEQRGRQ